MIQYFLFIYLLLNAVKSLLLNHLELRLDEDEPISTNINYSVFLHIYCPIPETKLKE